MNLEELQTMKDDKVSSSLHAKNKPSFISQRLSKNQMTSSSTSTKSSHNYNSQTILKPLQSPKIRNITSIHKIGKTKPLGLISPRNKQ